MVGYTLSSYLLSTYSLYHSGHIAASRRRRRSLEARGESAQRAFEIHQRRTGRSLRVTEQDVVNEEIYEEEDDDLPEQYRRLTAHLQTGSADFNRRLSAYLTNHVAMRSALDQAITNSYAQHYPDVPQSVHNDSYGQGNAGSPPRSFSANQHGHPDPKAIIEEAALAVLLQEGRELVAKYDPPKPKPELSDSEAPHRKTHVSPPKGPAVSQ